MTEKLTLVDQLKGASRLALEATQNVTNIVETMHVTIGSGPDLLGRPWESVTRYFTAPTYGAIRGVTALVGAGIELSVSRFEPWLDQSRADHNAFLAALNGVMGDYLVATANPLAIQMGLYRNGEALKWSPEDKTIQGRRLLITLHGSSLDESSWLRKGHDHSRALAEAFDFTVVHLRYNSGLHISQNGRAFAQLLEQLLAVWPRSIESIVFLGHSMGGLVARSACLAAEEENLSWRKKLGALLTLGTPHHGAPLERGGNWIDTLLGLSRYSAPLGQLGRLRSAGVTDLRYGNVMDSDWRDSDRFAKRGDPRSPRGLPRDVPCFMVAGSRSRMATASPSGDGIVPVASAFGQHRDPAFDLGLAEEQRFIAWNTSHLGLLSSPFVTEQLLTWLLPLFPPLLSESSTFPYEDRPDSLLPM